jgi:Dolichyl-phosphate-mannose-protein mannosyltransferase
VPAANRRARIAVFVGLGLLGAALLALYATLPPSPDQFEFDYMGYRLLAGDVPYHDVIDMNWPGPAWLHALSTLLFGNRLWSWRLFDGLLFAGSCYWLADLVRESAGERAGWLAASLGLLFYVGLPQWFSGQPDSTAGQLLVGTFWFQARGYSRDQRFHLGTGATLALGMLNKPTVGLLALLLPLQAYLCGVPWRRIVRGTALTGGAAVLTLLGALGILRAEGSMLHEVFDAAYLYNAAIQFTEIDSWGALARTFLTVHFVWWRWLLPGAVGGCIWMFRARGRTFATTTWPLFWLGGALSFVVQRKFYAYHAALCFFPVVGALSIGVSALGTARFRLARVVGPGRLCALGVAACVAVGASKLFRTYASAVAALAGAPYAAHLAQFVEGDGLDVAQSVALAERAGREVPPEGSLLVFGTASGPNFLARRRQPTRFFYAPVILNIEEKPEGRSLPMAKKWTQWFVDDLTRNEPSLCLVDTAYDDWLTHNTPAATALRTLLSRYEPAGYVGSPTKHLRVYARRDAASK